MKLSVFCLVSFAAFIFGMVEGADYVSARFQILIPGLTRDGVSQVVRLEYLNLFVWIILTIYAVRLYSHAWVVDESKKFREALKDHSYFKTIIEWLLRCTWILTIAFLPNVFSGNHHVFTSLNGVPPFSYLSFIALTMVVWGALLLPIIKKYSTQEKKDLSRFWYKFDLLIFAGWLFLAISFDYRLADTIMPQGLIAILQLISLTMIITVMVIQLIFWAPSIYKETIR